MTDKPIFECGECHKRFNDYDDLRDHNHSKEVICKHEVIEHVFCGLDHMNTEEAAGYFLDQCKSCGQKSKQQYLVSFRRKENEPDKIYSREEEAIEAGNEIDLREEQVE